MGEIEIVAELGVNWTGDIKVAERMMRSAKYAGADAVKFQAFLPEHVSGHPQEKELMKCSVDRPASVLLKIASEDAGIEWFCTPFYPEAIDFLEEAGVKKYKIRERDARMLVSQNGDASPTEASDLIKKAIGTHKPVYMSVQRKPLDMYFLYHPSISWLYCLPKYPAPIEELELWRCAFGYGFSCHTPEVIAPVVAASLMLHAKGVNASKVLEVHVSLEPKKQYIDGNVSFSFNELAQIVKTVRTLERMNLERPF